MAPSWSTCGGVGPVSGDDSPSPRVSDREDADVIDVVEVLDEELDKEDDVGEEPTDA